jgi:hypothetical protein
MDYLLVGVCLECGKVVNRTQQSGCDEVFPTAPSLERAGVFNIDMLMDACCCVAILTGWEVLRWDECNDALLYALRV